MEYIFIVFEFYFGLAVIVGTLLGISTLFGGSPTFGRLNTFCNFYNEIKTIYNDFLEGGEELWPVLTHLKSFFLTAFIVIANVAYNITSFNFIYRCK